MVIGTGNHRERAPGNGGPPPPRNSPDAKTGRQACQASSFINMIRLPEFPLVFLGTRGYDKDHMALRPATPLPRALHPSQQSRVVLWGSPEPLELGIHPVGN